MKKSKILAPALAVLCLSVAASVTGTVAWFASNNLLTAEGLSVYANVPSSLVIAQNLVNAPDGQTDLADRAVDLDFNSTATYLNPCTYADGQLEYISAIENGHIDNATGLPVADEGETMGDITYSAATEAGHYFKTFTAYIASAGAAIESHYQITASLTNSREVSDTWKAASVAFFLTPNGGSRTYAGSLNLADFDPVANDYGTTPQADKVIYTVDASHTIPTYSLNVGVKVEMLVYFDGALLKSDGQAFVTSQTGNSNELEMLVKFEGAII
ncbi:MAG: hypothetical protein H6688_02135 [Erysipelotrichaceae bacterium]|nr:hypothetical protein [Erysipelotrichaceae bacterium]